MIRARLTSVRLQLVAAMLGAALLGLAGAYYAYGGIEHAEERGIVRDRAASEARAIATRAAAGAGVEYFRLVQNALGDDRLIVVRDGRQVFAGPSRDRDITAQVTEGFPGGRVTVVANAFEDRWVTLELTLVAAGVIVLVIVVAVLAAAYLARGIRHPLERAVTAADRLASGDLSVRMGAAGPEELVRLGQAFDSMAERLEAVDREQRRFLADLTHEIATPLSSISGFALALSDGSAASPGEVREAAELLSASTVRLESLLTDVRRLGSLDLLESIHREQVDLRALCEELAAQVQPLARSAGVEVEVNAEDVSLVSDHALLETVGLNFLTNAVRYTPPGGKVEASTGMRNGYVVLAVRDTGIGISSQYRSRVFDRFYRVDEARARATGGSGLGLAIAQRAARALGGWIELDSEPGVGSEFRLVLPALTPGASRS